MYNILCHKSRIQVTIVNFAVGWRSDTRMSEFIDKGYNDDTRKQSQG